MDLNPSSNSLHQVGHLSVFVLRVLLVCVTTSQCPCDKARLRCQPHNLNSPLSCISLVRQPLSCHQMSTVPSRDGPRETLRVLSRPRSPFMSHSCRVKFKYRS
ncbi:hypothetical protein EV424DRAFT_1402795 [Suillus variegatus]|nr:hypothetical protein EV424DRAFT_1402795 [Suillus variegatus]